MSLQMPSSRVTAITITRNSEEFLPEALESLFSQTYPPFEILVVDGQSTDATAELVAAYPAIHWIPQPSLGLARARNLGIERARGEVIAFLDSDDVWHASKLEKQVAYLEQNPDVAYCLTRLQFIDSQAEPGRTMEAATPSALVARANIFQQLGGFDPDFTIGADAEWFTRARDAGLRSHTLPEVLLSKRLHSRNLSRDGLTNRHEMIEIARRSIARRRGNA